MKKYILEHFSCLHFPFLLIWFIFVSGCGHYLDLKSNATLVVPSTLEDLQSILDDSFIMNLQRTPSFGTSVADEYYLTSQILEAMDETQRDLYFWFDYEYYGVGNDWAYGYQVVYNTNLVFDLLEKIDRTPVNGGIYDNVIGSAHFYRGFYFLGLVTQFGHAFDEDSADQDLGIVLRLDSDFNVPSKRASVRESYKQIIEDLTKAIELLPDYGEHLMRPSRGAAHAALARTYLYMRKYDLAMEQSERALSLNDRLMDLNADEDVLNLDSSYPFKMYNKETIFYASASSSPIYITIRGVVDTLLYRSFHENDLRKYAYFNLIDGNPFFKGNYTNSNRLFGGLSTNELYLIQAECKAYLNDIEGAMDRLNTLLKARWNSESTYIPLTATTRLEALKMVRDERKKELCFRNLRWPDIKRYNKEDANIILERKVDGQIYELLPNAPFYALPLPKDIVELTGMQQN